VENIKPISPAAIKRPAPQPTSPKPTLAVQPGSQGVVKIGRCAAVKSFVVSWCTRRVLMACFPIAAVVSAVCVFLNDAARAAIQDVGAARAAIVQTIVKIDGLMVGVARAAMVTIVFSLMVGTAVLFKDRIFRVLPWSRVKKVAIDAKTA
jgi:hypothetical protein